MAKKKTAPSKRRKKQLAKSRTGAQGKKLYSVTPSKVTDQEIKWMAQTINRRLRALEKAGLTDASNEYDTIRKYAMGDPHGMGSIYNVNMDRGTIRVTSSTRGMTPKERAYLVTTMRNILAAKTSTVSGTKKAREKAYQTFMADNPGLSGKLSKDKYDEMWKLFRLNVDPDRKDRAASQMVVKLLNETNFYSMSLQDMETAFQYAATFESPADWADSLVEGATVESPFGTSFIQIEFT